MLSNNAFCLHSPICVTVLAVIPPGFKFYKVTHSYSSRLFLCALVANSEGVKTWDKLQRLGDTESYWRYLPISSVSSIPTFVSSVVGNWELTLKITLSIPTSQQWQIGKSYKDVFGIDGLTVWCYYGSLTVCTRSLPQLADKHTLALQQDVCEGVCTPTQSL